MKMFLLVGALLAMPIHVAYANDDDSYYPDFPHQLDHREHEGFHEDSGEAHEEAHDRGFWSRRDHRDWHRAYRDAHDDFHDDHPYTGHDHRDWYGPLIPYRARPAAPYDHPWSGSNFTFGW